MIAGTTSGASKILPAMILGVLTGGAATAAAGAYGTAAGAATTLAGLGGTFALNYGAGAAENNTEVAQAYGDEIKDYLTSHKGFTGSLYDDLVAEGRKKLSAKGLKNLSDDQIFERFQLGQYDTDNAKINKAAPKIRTGIENQFRDDMMATTYGSAIESVLETGLGPLGKAIKVPRAIRYAMLRSQKGRQFMRGQIGSTTANNLG